MHVRGINDRSKSRSMKQQKLFKIKEKRIEDMTYKELRKVRHDRQCQVIRKNCKESIRDNREISAEESRAL